MKFRCAAYNNKTKRNKVWEFDAADFEEARDKAKQIVSDHNAAIKMEERLHLQGYCTVDD